MFLVRIPVTSYKNQDNPDGLHSFLNTFYAFRYILNWFILFSLLPEHPVIRLIKIKHISSSLFALKALKMIYCAVGGHLGDLGSMCNIIQSCIKTLANLV